MKILSPIVGILWLAWLIFWLASAFNVKKNADKSIWKNWWWTRVIIAILVIALLEFNDKAKLSFGQTVKSFTSHEITYIGIFGVILVIIGLGFSVWARIHLGRNWSNYPTHKIDHELVTSGPYRFVRHPIYTGMILGAFGTTLIIGIPWFILFLIATVVFLIRITAEEKIMTEQFPDAYPEYKKRTKALIPFIW